ncbi:similar to Saccharomyces cerevisiae YGR264C MES1 Methionyl-tRNA synthetase [Geotrichum candidum]|uniref:methionine--tRNA ligase n=1 Tax=Geotrichum candidum TaxID=1173061 RepID=A0A0J9X8F0_GEOCN|nr:similar to Saccharomyces cerevisiae YGR264C MES1 Methionyl-tRNA synthetase [Geotrichum candidum]
MAASKKLEVPVAQDGLIVAGNIKVTVASNVFGAKLTPIIDEESKSQLLTLENTTLFEPNAIVRFLSGSAVANESLIGFEETAIYNGIKSKKPVDFSKISNLKAEPTVDQIILFGGVYGLVHDNGVKVLPENITDWYKEFSKIPAVEAAVKASSKFVKKPQAPLPEYTGKVNIDESVYYKAIEGKIVPKEGERNILVTSALPYVNNVPHLGNIVGSVLSADIYARYTKNRGYNTLFVCGTDEYGTATETKALEEGVSPKALCDKYHVIHKQTYDWFQIGFDHFGRTTTPKQTEIAQHIFTKLNDNGYLEEQSMKQLYCPVHNGFLADRFVEGTCPKCSYTDARGDQCDGCGTLLNPFELIEPRCKIDNATPIPRESNHIFLSLDKLQDQVAEWNKKSQELGKWSKNSKTITDTWLNEGLHPRCITRDLKWGTPVPLATYADKVLYVWFDACIGYVSITANYLEDWESWWRNPENVQLYQFMGKDNVPFHTVVFPASQLGTKEKWTMLHHLSTTEYLQYEGGKFSKSRNVGVFGNNAQDTGIPPSVWRYYLATARPETSDTQFSWQEFVTRNNSELLANLGNFVNRLVKFVSAKFNKVVPEYDVAHLDYAPVEKDLNQLLASYNEAMEAVSERKGLEIAMQISARGNQFLQDNKLDNSLLANHPEKAAAVIGVGINIIYLLSAIFTPFMPETGSQILEQLNAPARKIPNEFTLPIKGGHNLGKPAYLFSRIDDKKVEEWRAKFGGGSNV